LKLRNFTVLEVPQEAILLLGPTLISQIEYILEELSKEFILEEGPFEILVM
jgi:hypothetical protein